MTTWTVARDWMFRWATHSVRLGTKLDVVRQVLGHASLATTSIYVELARDVMDKDLQEHAL